MDEMMLMEDPIIVIGVVDEDEMEISIAEGVDNETAIEILEGALAYLKSL